jgi:hypothetical protein
MPENDGACAKSVESFLRTVRSEGSTRLRAYFLEENLEPASETSGYFKKIRRWTNSKEGIVCQYEIIFFGGGEVMQKHSS